MRMQYLNRILLIVVSSVLLSCYETTYMTIEELLHLHELSSSEQEKYLLNKNYIFDQYSKDSLNKIFVRRFSDGFLAKLTASTDYEPNDWSGVREALVASNGGDVSYFSRDKNEFFRSKDVLHDLGFTEEQSKADSTHTFTDHRKGYILVRSSIYNNKRENMNFGFDIISINSENKGK